MIYSIIMNKGGVGKTSLVTNLAAIASKNKRNKVLIVDSDGQGNCSLAFGLVPHQHKKTIHDVFLGRAKIEDIIIKIGKNLSLAPANSEMNWLEFDVLTRLDKYPKPFELLAPAIQEIKKEFDYIFIDTPPSFGLVTGNVLACSNKVLIPFEPELFSVQGLIKVIEAIEEFKEENNKNLEIAGVVGMKIDSRTSLHSEMLQSVRAYCFKKEILVYDNIIPRSIRFASAFAYEGKPAVFSNQKNHLVKSYFDLAKEVFINE